MKGTRQRVSEKYLVFGAIFTILGGVMLLRTTGYLPSLGSLWPVVFVVSGLVLLYLVKSHQASENYLLLGMLFSLGGLFFLLFMTVFSSIPLRDVWPILMAILGISLIPYGMTKMGNSRTALLVPGIMITALSLLFLPFSLGIVRIRFRVFVAMWWPALFLILGIVLLVAYFRKKSERSDIS